MRRRRPGQTLQTTALVPQTFMRLAGARQVDWQDRRHFLAVAARTMRRLLVDLARAQGTAKRGSRAVHLPLESNVAVGGPHPLDLIALDQALETLAALDARKVRVIELRFFAGLTVDETAHVLEVSPDTVARDWRNGADLVAEGARHWVEVMKNGRHRGLQTQQDSQAILYPRQRRRGDCTPSLDQAIR